MQCTKCDKEAQYIIDGESVCKEHKGYSKPEEKRTQGQILSGM